MTGSNSGRSTCKAGDAFCGACGSELGCVQGGCGTRLIEGQGWTLRASHLAGGGVPIMCDSTSRETLACLRPTSRGDAIWSCLPMSETCDHRARSDQASMGVTTEDLTLAGLDIEIRDPNGNVLAQKLGAKHPVLLQLALCIGVTFPLQDVAGSGISTFAFFLTPSAPLGPGPQRWNGARECGAAMIQALGICHPTACRAASCSVVV